MQGTKIGWRTFWKARICTRAHLCPQESLLQGRLVDKNKFLEAAARKEAEETERLLAKATQDFFTILQGSVYDTSLQYTNLY